MKPSPENTRNIGFIAHVDAGKTTLTERFLYYTGVQRFMGEVADGTATMDWMPQERKRGITITAAATSCVWLGHRFNIIDMPGHIDFTVEVERSLRVLDGAVVLFSAVEGVEPQSESVWRQADRYGVPRIAYVNKMDRVGANLDAVMQSIREKLHPKAVLYQLPVRDSDGFVGVVDLVRQVAVVWTDPASRGMAFRETPIPEDLRSRAAEARANLVDVLAEEDDEVIDRFLSGDALAPSLLWRVTRQAVLAGRIVPVLCGAAARNAAVQPLLDAIVRYLPAPSDLPIVRSPAGRTESDVDGELDSRDGPFCALAFKVLAVPSVGPVTWLRVYRGRANTGDVCLNPRTGGLEVLGQVYRLHADRIEEVVGLCAGDIVAVAGLKAATGDTLCDAVAPLLLEPIRIPAPVMSVAIEPATAEQIPLLQAALTRLQAEDPTFTAGIDPETGQRVMSGMGELHLDVARSRLEDDFGLELRVGRPRVAFRERVVVGGSGTARFERVIGGRGHFAALTVSLLPGQPGSGLAIELGPAAALNKELQAAVFRGLRNGAEGGLIAGYALIDSLIRVDAFEHHEVDSTEVAFEAVGLDAVVGASRSCELHLIEPIMRVEVTAPEGYVGVVIGELNSRRGSVVHLEGGLVGQIIAADVPLAGLFGYATDLRSATQGRASFSMHFHHYASVPAAAARQAVQRWRGA